MKKEFLMSLLRNGEARLVNIRLFDNRLVKWVIRKDNKLFCLVEGERFMTVLQPLTNDIADAVFDGLDHKRHDDLKSMMPLYEYCDEYIAYVNFPADDDLINHFSYKAVVKASYVLIAHSDMYDTVLCSINADAIKTNVAYNIVKQHIRSCLETIYQPKDIKDLDKTDWRIQCEKLCDNAGEYVFMYDYTTSFNFYYSEHIDIID